MEELIHIDNLCSRCGFFTSDTSVNGGYGCNHKDCDDGEYEKGCLSIALIVAIILIALTVVILSYEL